MNTQMPQGYFSAETTDIAAFRAVVEDSCTAADAPRASRIEQNVPIYDAGAVDLVGDGRTALMAEWAQVLMHGAGVLAITGAYADTAVLDEANTLFNDIIASETAAGSGADHFAAAGSNARIWNVAEKMCLRDPDLFVRYFSNLAIATVSEAWLGPGYQMTAQVNLVRPGGPAQTCHRDYHLGFMTPDQAARYPAHVHRLSPVLTLQGAVAHCDMPVASGPTKLLPFSQRYDAGYMAYARPEFAAYFEDHCVQIPLSKGDTLFFNPALFHAAGANTTTDVHRMANLLQVGSPMGISLEALDRATMCKAMYGALRDRAPGMATAEITAAIAACAEGYAFPTSLDRDPPVGGLAPPTQADLMAQGLDQGWDVARLHAEIDARQMKRWGKA